MAAGAPIPLDQQFLSFSKYQDDKSDGKTISLSCVDRWLKQAKLLDGRKITNTQTGVTFYKMKKRAIDYQQFLKFLEDLAAITKIDLDELKKALMECGAAGADQKKEEEEKKRPTMRKF